ncbi:MORN motif [Phytophthora cactorum]|nr:MORN motif [Phytophthora cactorum]
MRAVYKGDLVEGIRQGKGELTFVNGDTYEGEFLQGFRHGHGVFTSHHRTRVYDGEWRRGERHGVGKERWLVSGDRYEGEYQHDVFHGKGVLTRGSSVEGSSLRSTSFGRWQNGNDYIYIPNYKAPDQHFASGC